MNSTFYRLARPAAVARWVEETPADFRFTVKASRYLTHMRRLHGHRAAGSSASTRGSRRSAESPKLGPLLWQLPENFHRDDDRLAAALEALPPGRHAFEFRHASWFAARCSGCCTRTARRW